MPDLASVAGVAAGLVVPSMAAAQLNKFLPASITGSTVGQLAVKAAGVVVPSMLVRKYVSRRAGEYMLVAGVASLALDGVRMVAPGLLAGFGAQPLLGYYTGGAMLRGYVDSPTTGLPYGSAGNGVPGIIASIPERSDPRTRF